MSPAEQPPWYAPLLRCLACSGTGLQPDPAAAQIRCPRCNATWPILDGIPALGGPPEAPSTGDKLGEEAARTQEAVRRFYEKNPFPTYDDFDSVGSLLEKARRSIYAQLLDDQIPTAAKVLECGCGTGQLSTFLSIANRRCLGVDMCMASLRCGKGFRDRHHLTTVDFVQGNLFDLPVAEGTFDLVISKGVLHHTPDARRAFGEIVKRCRPGGYVLVGLYNRYGRIPTFLRKQLFRVLGRDFRGGDYVMRKVIRSEEKRRIWWEDQYNNPHETWHSVDEVLRWFDEEGLRYVSAYPRITLGSQRQAALFQPQDPGSSLEHLLVQLGWIFTISREGALFDLIARKEAPRVLPAPQDPTPGPAHASA